MAEEYYQPQPTSPTTHPPPTHPPTRQIHLLDRMYWNSHRNVKFWATVGHIYNFFKGSLLLGFILTFYRNDFRDAFFEELVVVVECSVALAYANKRLQKLCGEFEKCVDQAGHMGHTVRVVVSGLGIGTGFDNSVSVVYDAMNEAGHMTEEEVLVAEKRLGEQIRERYLARSRSASICMFLGNIVNMCMVCNFILLLGDHQATPFQKYVIITYIVIELLIKIEYVLLFFGCLLIPVVCIVMCLYALVKKPPNARNFADTLEAFAYDPQTTTVTDTQCTICYQNFEKDDRVVSLTCNDKHTFHEPCIKDWLKIGSTCPLCRYDFSQTV